jgi:hypothetical protein
MWWQHINQHYTDARDFQDSTFDIPAFYSMSVPLRQMIPLFESCLVRTTSKILTAKKFQERFVAY